MASKCVHKGCGKEFTDADEPCVYHPGPPVFHEGQKGWKCCKPRVLTFDEFLAIPPCTTGKHSTVDDTPVEAPKPAADLAIPANATCRRRGCNAGYDASVSRDEEKCVYHPGQPIFHEGSKGWSCCKKRVLEFDEFLKIQGCSEKKKHLFVGKGKPPGEEKVESVRNDFYQTASSVNVSLYLKKINKDTAKVEFKATSIELDLPTTDNKRYTDSYELFAPIDPEQSKFRVLGTKLELTLVKADGTSWPVLRRDDKWSGERIQIGNAGRV
ncbi:14-3-3 family protein [Aspergillus niger]|uniref:14-3-3 family protein n=1 Tax=Aspergillus niger TaxID=5061 RepID=A0A505HWU7_ASPNG|nr:14-3-3 family protein [Aspergillus niger]